MAEPLTMGSERVDDGPVCGPTRWPGGGTPLVDAHVPIHGHGVGWSLGWVSVLGVVQLLSAGDQRLNPVAPWATQRLHTRREGTGPPVHPLDSSDNRWAPGLEAVRDESRGRAVAGALHQHPRRGSCPGAHRRAPGSYHRQRARARDGRWTVLVRPQPGPSSRPAPGEEHGIGLGAAGYVRGDGRRLRASGPRPPGLRPGPHACAGGPEAAAGWSLVRAGRRGAWASGRARGPTPRRGAGAAG